MPPLHEALAAPATPGDRLVEVGVGRRTGVAAELARAGYDVVATDVRDRAVPDGVTFRIDDVTAPDPATYAGAAVVYALRCPPELQRPLRAVAAEAGARCAFTTLGGDPATVPVDRERVDSGTLYWVRE